jgi:hypothetical protein
VRISFPPCSVQSRPFAMQFRHGVLSEHFKRYVRHQLHALDTCCRFDREGVIGDSDGPPPWSFPVA